MKRAFLVLLLVALLLALTPAVAYAGPPAQDGTGEEESTIAKVIGALGLYAAMMMVLAVGAEVVIDAVRPIFGLKRQTSATEAINKMREWLPGTLADLGASTEAQRQLNASMEKLEELTTSYEDRAEELHNKIQEAMPTFVKELASKDVRAVMDNRWSELASALKLEENDEGAIKAWFEETLKELQGTNATEIAAHLQATSTLLDTVRKRNNELGGILGRAWSGLRQRMFRLGNSLGEGWLGKFFRFVLFIPSYLEYAWAWLRNRLPDGETFNKKLENLGQHKPFGSLTTLEEAATRIFEEDAGQKNRENARISWIRVLSAVVGIVLAASLRVDAIQLLSPILGDTVGSFARVDAEGQAIEWCTVGQLIEKSCPGEAARVEAMAEGGGVAQAASNVFQAVMVVLLNLTPGIYLSGLGAAAGSSFWHDQLDKLRSAKTTVSQVEELAGQIKRMGG
ncbi:MAG: hypothetical protein DRJ03_05780 [Chloroflexi bacterium]|nr:MAG: hypothetical protein B6I35_03255 [Anaerolineaceae bacterium 4572_32.2]RLC80238.1 MAG: hypothetical protein DRI81_04355 [Chloroflexota bacterium]RLC87516.1 MAG: hypothetical protein DRJ03_05780 [Chloroflexota bacterium]